jgi:hypothetical protein
MGDDPLVALAEKGISRRALSWPELQVGARGQDDGAPEAPGMDTAGCQVKGSRKQFDCLPTEQDEASNLRGIEARSRRLLGQVSAKPYKEDKVIGSNHDLAAFVIFEAVER